MDDIVRRWVDGDALDALGHEYRASRKLVGIQIRLSLSPEFWGVVVAEWSRAKSATQCHRPDIAVRQDEIARRWIDGDYRSLLADEYRTTKSTIHRWIDRALSPEFREVTAKEWKRIANKCPKASHFKKGQVASGRPYKEGEIRGNAARRYLKKYTVRMHTERVPGSARIIRFKVIKFQDVPGEGHRNWMPLARYLWQLWHGPIPKGYVVVHKNGDKLDDTRDNLIVIRKQDVFKYVQQIRPKVFTHEVMSKRSRKAMNMRLRIKRAMKEKAMAGA